MPDRVRTPTLPAVNPLIASARVYAEAQTSSANRIFQYESWQQEAWGFYDSLGEFEYGVTWLSNALSRVRLTAAELVPGGDEPEPLEDGPAVELVEQLGGGIAGRAALMKAFGLHLSVPGECWMVAERYDRRIPLAQADWAVKSTDEIRPRRGQPGYEIRVDDNQWRSLAPESLPVRVWDPHPRWSWKATSAARAAIPIMRTVELLNRRIIATLVSRLAMNGLLLIPQEYTINAPAQYQDAPDPFVAMLIDIAGKNIREPGSATASIPIPLKFASEAIEKWRHITFNDGVDKELIEEREKELGRLATTLNMPSEVLRGIGDVNHWCTLPDVEIMTTSGWKTYDQLAPGEEVLTLNHESGLSEWQPLLAVNTWDVVDEPMVHIEGRRHSSVTTANHRWPILSGNPGSRGRAWTTSGEIAAGARKSGLNTQRQEYLLLAAPNADLPAEPKYSDALVELVAWYYTEGSLGIREGRRTPQVVIHQSPIVNADHCARIERALTTLFGPTSDSLDKGGRYASSESVRRNAEARRLKAENPKMPVADIAAQLGVSSVQVYKYLKQEPKVRDNVPRWRVQQRSKLNRYVLNAAAAEVILEHAPQRVVKLDFIRSLTAAQLELFIDISIKGDGNYMNGKTPVFGQKNPAMCDAFELAGILSGRSINRQPHTTYGASANGPRLKTQDVVILSDRTTFAPRGRSFTEEAYTGTIWCPTTPNGTWLARHNGTVFFTGNSAWQLEESGIKLHISPVAETVVGALTVGYLNPMAKTAGVDLVGPNGGKIVVWYDPTELTARPDKSAQAALAHDRIAISDTALRRESGLDESDAPTDDETRRQLLVKLVAAGNVQAYEALTGEPLTTPAQPATAGAETLAPDVSQPSGPGGNGGASVPSQPAVTPGARTTPPTRDQPPPTPDDGMAALSRRVTALLPERALAAAGLRAPPARVNGSRHSRDGPNGRRR